MIHFKINITKALSCALLMSFLIMLMFAPSALAANGDGTGGGKSEPLALVSSTPASGQQGVQLPVNIMMTFTKNVVNMSVHDNNLKCFALYTGNGVRVPIEVVMADDQIYPEQREQVVLKPLQALQAGASYTIKIAPGLKAKSGATLANEVDITFTTATAAATPSATQVQMPQQGNPVQQAPGNAATSGSTPVADQSQAGSPGGSSGGPSQPATGAASVASTVVQAPQTGTDQVKHDQYDNLLQGLITLLIVLIVTAMVVCNTKRGRRS